ncbi:putative quinol monooxygenase [Actibacterium sp. 188UL27-1]|uniref:putative quinol monooxygenase n=1 Tax=Actibacterium sp. 188UL27-1 TaxID=2786961 RepID=UPI00195D989A|nr:antibiotic biosynthesis monooxygenase [Actibacterium sp. 188UL27-1]MBM7069169.1 antibiotic biosynthesis monooxygenase [Actibacterium sp. 188UL27-1]
MSIWVTLNLEVATDKAAALQGFLEEKLPTVRGFAGALSVTVYQDPESPRMLILEEWMSRQHHQDYIAAITENGVMAQLAGFMAAPPRIEYFTRSVI